VAATNPRGSTTAWASCGSSGTRIPIASGVVPQSQRNRRAGLGRTSVYGPGSSARAATAARPRASGTASRIASRSPAMSATGSVSGRFLSR
jgi:hypothetical protein